MTTVSDILHFLQTVAPPYMASDWDRIGLNCGHADAPVTTVLVALDPFIEVCEEARALGAQLLVTHHPLIWEAGFVSDCTAQGKAVLFLAENGIAHMCAHTNLDCAPGGVNDIFAEKLGLRDVQVIAPQGTDASGRPWGLLRCGTVIPCSLDSFLQTVKSALSCKSLRYAPGGSTVSKVAVGGGACASELRQAFEAGCDTFVTADAKYNQFRDAADLGITLIDAGHYCTEKPVCAVLAARLQAHFPEIRVVASGKNTDPVNFF